MQNQSEKEITTEVIIGYRKIIASRYNYENLMAKYSLPESFDEERMMLFRDYFLNNIYPAPQKREELNDAFNQLDNYIKNPEKLFRLLIDSTRLIFKYGRHLPKILKAGIRTLRSFRTGTEFEKKLVQQAILSNLPSPYSEENINTLIKKLSPEEINEFIENSQALFEVMYDRVLVKKIQEIVQHLIKKMKSRPNIYSSEEIKGLEIGYDIIKKGDLLFDKLSKSEQKLIFDFVIKVEKDVLRLLFEKNLNK